MTGASSVLDLCGALQECDSSLNPTIADQRAMLSDLRAIGSEPWDREGHYWNTKTEYTMSTCRLASPALKSNSAVDRVWIREQRL